MGKLSEVNANVVLSGLFPGYKGGRQKRKFDPNDESMVAEQHRKKKVAFKENLKGPKSILVMMVEGHLIPRGNKKETL